MNLSLSELFVCLAFCLVVAFTFALLMLLSGQREVRQSEVEHAHRATVPASMLPDHPQYTAGGYINAEGKAVTCAGRSHRVQPLRWCRSCELWHSPEPGTNECRFCGNVTAMVPPGVEVPHV